MTWGKKPGLAVGRIGVICEIPKHLDIFTNLGIESNPLHGTKTNTMAFLPNLMQYERISFTWRGGFVNTRRYIPLRYHLLTPVES